MHNYMFNNSAEVRYEDFLHFKKLSEINEDKSSKLRQIFSAVMFGVAGMASAISAIFWGMGSSVIRIISTVLAGTSSALLFLNAVLVGFNKMFSINYNINDENSAIYNFTKDQIADLKAELKALKRGNIWKNYNKVMKEYYASAKFLPDKFDYEQKLKTQESEAIINKAKTAQMEIDNAKKKQGEDGKIKASALEDYVSNDWNDDSIEI